MKKRKYFNTLFKRRKQTSQIIQIIKYLSMSVLIFLDQADGQIRKSSLEAACYGVKIAEQTGTTAEEAKTALQSGSVNLVTMALRLPTRKRSPPPALFALNSIQARLTPRMVPSWSTTQMLDVSESTTAYLPMVEAFKQTEKELNWK